MRQPLLFLELNEVNFDYVRKYCAQGQLPHLSALLSTRPLVRTTSEAHHHEIEPWVQWVSAHTGLPLAEHGIFRLGDITRKDLPQIWEQLEDQGLKVGAVSPMNAKHRLRRPAFFVPDPWTPTACSAPYLLKQLHAAIAQAVSDNAHARLTAKSLFWLSAGLASYARPRRYREYARLAVSARHRPWLKAIFLDLLLADVFLREVQRTRPDFATLFLNAAAHIQHHYLFSSASYEGQNRNPSWYVPDNCDPVLDVYRVYDQIVGDVARCLPNTRLMLATGLHQVPHQQTTYYWRLRDHEAFLREIGIAFVRCEPRMSRDFLISFRDEASAREAERRLTSAVAQNGRPMFEVDNRGKDAFVTLIYASEIDEQFTFRIDGKPHRGLYQHVAFVALKNGEHDGVGYFIDSQPDADLPAEMALTDLPKVIARAVGRSLPSHPRNEQRAPSPAA